MKTEVYWLTIVTVMLLIPLDSFVYAQPGANPGGGGVPGGPISGIEILIGLGGLLGAKKLFDARKKNQKLP